MDTIANEQAECAELKIVKRPIMMPLSYYEEGVAGYWNLKRGFDIVVSLVLIVAVLSWLCPLLFILINISSRGGTFFIQKRIGLDGRIFKCIKFRTMVVNKDADTLEAAFNDKRITKIGKWLRMTYIDELPQLFNVLYGDMSIVGPRPHMLYHHRKFSMEIPSYNLRHRVKPGITGLAQIKGYHGSVFDHYRIYGRTKLDLFYVQKASFTLDMSILMETVLIIFTFNKKSR